MNHRGKHDHFHFRSHSLRAMNSRVHRATRPCAPSSPILLPHSPPISLLSHAWLSIFPFAYCTPLDAAPVCLFNTNSSPHDLWQPATHSFSTPCERLGDASSPGAARSAQPSSPHGFPALRSAHAGHCLAALGDARSLHRQALPRLDLRGRPFRDH